MTQTEVEAWKAALSPHLGCLSAAQFREAFTRLVLTLLWSQTRPLDAKRALRNFRTVIEFLEEFTPPELHKALVDLHLIAQDLHSTSQGGTVSRVFQPQHVRSGRRRNDVQAALRGRAARACTELMKCGDRLEAATKTVGKIVGRAPGTVRSWRKECLAHASTPTTEVMRAYYSGAIPGLSVALDTKERRSLILAFLKRAVDQAAIHAP